MRKKYKYLGRFAGPVPQEPEGRGMVLIQIDGISYDSMLKTISLGYAPSIRRLVQKKGYRLVPWNCEAPSNTPYVQAGIMYGRCSGIPGFRWFDKSSGREWTFKDPESAAQMEKILSEERPGILFGGSSYLNLYTGGAERSVFTLSTFASESFMRHKKIRQMDIFILFVLYISNIIRTLASLIYECLLEFSEWLYCLFFRKSRRGEGVFPFIRLINNVVFREIETMGAITDIVRGVPALYLTFNGYDEMAHHRGPDFRGSYRVLRGIDRQVRKIEKAIRSSPRKKYDLYIFSDHGQTASLPFEDLYGERLEDLIARSAGKDIETREFHSPEESVLHDGRKYMEELGVLVLKLPFFVFALFDRLVRMLIMKGENIEPFEWMSDREQVVICDSGPISHIYFNFSSQRVSFKEIEERYPGLISALKSHEGIGLIIAAGKDGSPEILKSEGSLGEEDIGRLLSVAGEEKAGDIVLQGYFDGANIVNFEKQLSGHGGSGGGQTRPFFMCSAESCFDISRVKKPCDLYTFFFENYTKRAINASLISGDSEDKRN